MGITKGPGFDDLNILMRRTVVYARTKLQAHPELTVQPEDIAQEAYLYAHSHYDSNRGGAQEFLYWRVRHEIDALKRLSATKNEIYNADEKVVLLFRDRGAPPDEEYRRRKLLEFIESRNREAKVVAAWILYGDLKSSKEIAIRMGVSPSHVDYIKKILKSIMEERRLHFTEKIDAPSEVEK